jgi:hypothetical protein
MEEAAARKALFPDLASFGHPRIMVAPGKRRSPAKEGLVADKATQLILGALSRAAAEPAGAWLYGNKTQPGLFAATTLARQAAQRCLDEGYLRVVGTETRGKATRERCAVTDKGLAYLLAQVNPRQVLEDFIRTLDARHGQVKQLVESARQMQAGVEALKGNAEAVLQQVQHRPPLAAPSANGHRPAAKPPAEEPVAAVTTALRSRLASWAAAASEDCPLPELYRQVRQALPALTIGQFHDALRRLHEQGHIYLHPWTGPLHELPEPPYALLGGHEIAYYASLRQDK